ncbi:MAG: class I poly(R)-hydroxyalkanoic acid synthase [Pseudomonadota bacterium]
MTSDPETTTFPSLEEMQHWTWVIGKAQQLMIEHGLKGVGQGDSPAPMAFPSFGDGQSLAKATTDFWTDSLNLWQRFLTPSGADAGAPSVAVKDRRFAAPEWAANPVFDMIRQSYLMISNHMLKAADSVQGVDPAQKEKIAFATRTMVEAMSPANFAMTNPVVLQKTMESGGQNLLKGLEHMLADIERGQLTHTDPDAFEVGRNIAITPGKIIHETPLYQLIHYAPTTPDVLATPLVIFPPWINRFYILDLNPEKSFIKWAVEQGVSVFIVSWKSADASMKDVVWDDYVVRGEIDAIDTVRNLLGVESVHTIGYCVAGTTLAAALALLEARGEAAKVKSATFFTAQVDFSKSGELQVFIDDEQLKMIEGIASDGYLDGRYMALTFNLLRGRDLIWNYVVNNYLLGEDYPPFDLLHWNGDTTNLPVKWHQSYLKDLYRDNRLVIPGSMVVADTPIDLRTVKTPSYVQAGREDHIAPAESVWKIMDHFAGAKRFVLAGSGHIAGVVNPPSANKYQYWRNDAAKTFAEYVAGATETKGSWWPDWIEWLRGHDGATVKAEGARIPGKGALKAIEDAPGRYAKMR